MDFEKDGYVKVKNLLSRDICKIAENYALYDRFNDYTPDDNQVLGSHIKYADSLMESLLLFLKPEIEKCVDLQLLPTYSYMRIYRPGDVLEDHRDRPSCEISVTIPLGFRYIDKSEDYKWPIHVFVNDEKRYIHCDIGEGLIYKGCDIKHGRDLFDVAKGSYQIQVFLHYVDANGSYAKTHKYDGRKAIGVKTQCDKSFPFFIK
jgi:hypothetical protein